PAGRAARLPRSGARGLWGRTRGRGGLDAAAHVAGRRPAADGRLGDPGRPRCVRLARAVVRALAAAAGRARRRPTPDLAHGRAVRVDAPDRRAARAVRLLDDRFQTPAPLDTAANLRWTCVLGLVHAFMHELRPASFASSIFAAPVTRGFAIDHLRGRGRFPRREGRIPSGPALSVRRSTTAMSTEMDKE